MRGWLYERLWRIKSRRAKPSVAEVLDLLKTSQYWTPRQMQELRDRLPRRRLANSLSWRGERRRLGRRGRSRPRSSQIREIVAGATFTWGMRPGTPASRARFRQARTVLRSKPNRAAAGLTPWAAAYSSTARRPCTFHRYRRLIERSSMKGPLSGFGVIPAPSGVPFQRKYFKFSFAHDADFVRTAQLDSALQRRTAGLVIGYSPPIAMRQERPKQIRCLQDRGNIHHASNTH